MVAVLDASSVLEVTEFRLFELAFKDWYGKNADESVIEKHFADYMFASRIPGWARQFSRKILKLHAEGRLNPQHFNVFQPLPSARMKFLGKAYAVFLLIAFTIMGLSVYFTPPEVLKVFEQCYFPPCY